MPSPTLCFEGWLTGPRCTDLLKHVGQPPGGLLVEIAMGDTVGVVARRGIGYGEEVVVTPERPWALTTCNERVLTDVGTVMDVAHEWITAGRLDTSRYELRPVDGFELPRLGS